MTLGIMQPYFFPYIGYFSLIKHVDHFILFDTPQFIRHGWVDRNRTLSANGDPIYIRVPLMKHHQTTPINELKIRFLENWQEKIFAQLTPYKKRAPNYKQTIDLLKYILSKQFTQLAPLNHHITTILCEHLNIQTPITKWSSMDMKIEEVREPDEWALNICKAMGSNSYINPIGGVSFFDRNKYEKNGIEIKFLNSIPAQYPQLNTNFQPFLSIIDILMFNSPKNIQEMLNQFELV
jgi:hypothetical protein